MRIPTPIQALSAAAALALLAGCSSGSAIAPHMSTPAGHHVVSNMGHVPAMVGPKLASMISSHPSHRASFDACPATGNIEYISDFNDSIVNIYAGKFHGQAPCGSITGVVLNPQGMFVDEAHHLYVADTGNGNVLEFKRGSVTPMATFVDTANGNSEFPVDVTVAKDKTVIATNIFAPNTGIGSISTWLANGTFVGNFVNPNSAADYFLTTDNAGNVFMDDNTLSVYEFQCPAGACNTQTNAGATGFAFPGGLREGPGQDLILQDQSASGGGAQLTYESLPGGPAQQCTVAPNDDAVAFDLNEKKTKYFYADATANVGGEVKYPSCAAVGTVPGNSGGLPIGAAADAPGDI